MKKFNQVNNLIGENLRKIRETEKFTQAQFASEVNKLLKEYGLEGNYEAKSISNWEMGKSVPQINVLIAISRKYNLSLDELLKEEVKNIVEKQNLKDMANTNILDEYKKDPSVCIIKDNKMISAWNPQKYRYGKLSYVVDNLISYKGSLSKHFSLVNDKKVSYVLVGILDINDGKREPHFLGNGPDDIVDVEVVPENYSIFNTKNNSVIDTIMYNDIESRGTRRIVKLGDGRVFELKESDETVFNDEDYLFGDTIPEDLGKELIVDPPLTNWCDYVSIKGSFDTSYFSNSGGFGFLYKDAGIIAFFEDGTVEINDNQLVKILTDDYNHRLIRTLSEASDEEAFLDYKKQIDDYKEFTNPESVTYELNYSALDGLDEYTYTGLFTLSLVFKQKNKKHLLEDLKFQELVISADLLEKIYSLYLENNSNYSFPLMHKEVSGGKTYYSVERFGKYFKRIVD